jgi:hypothetical protein
MPHMNIDSEIDDPRVPDDLRVKAQKLARERIDEAKRRVYDKAQRMTPKKAAKVTAEQLSRATEKARQRLAWQKRMASSPEPTFNQPSLVGQQDTYYSVAAPENNARFTPRQGLVNIAQRHAEGVRPDAMESYAVPDEAGHSIPSNAVDAWARAVRRREQPAAPSVSAPNDPGQSEFRKHPYSDVHYPDEGLAQGMGGTGEDQPAGGSLDTADTVVPITPSDPTTKTPLEPTAVDIAKAEVAAASQATKAATAPLLLALGAGALYLLSRKG